MAAASTPPSFYSSMAQAQPGGAPPAAGGDGGKGGDPDDEIVQAVGKMFSLLNKIPKMASKDGTQPYIERAKAALKEMVVDALKKDPKDLDSPPGGGDKPTTGAEAPPAPPTPKPGEAVPA